MNMLSHQTLIHKHKQPRLPCSLRRYIISDAQLHPNHKRTPNHILNLNCLLHNRLHVLAFAEYVNNVYCALNLFWNFYYGTVAFFAENPIDEGVNGNYGVTAVSYTHLRAHE